MPEDRSYKDKTMVPTPERAEPDGTSPYLKWQDKNGDGLPDVCSPVPTQSKVCLDCIPNPYAMITNWRNRDQTEPIINEKNCKYQITMVVAETTTGYTDGMTEDEADEALRTIFTKYAPEAVQIILEEFQKDDSRDTIEKILQVVHYTDFDLQPNPGSRLKLLFSIDFEHIHGLPPIKDDEDEEEAPQPDDVTVKFQAGAMNEMHIKLRKGLNLYNRYLKVYRAVEGGNLKFKETGNLFNLGDYGDDAVFGSSAIAKVFTDLDSWLDSRGYTVSAGFWDWFSMDKQVTQLVMVFDGHYNIKKMKVFTESCKNRPKVYNRRRLASLRRRSGWRDKTAVAYLANMNALVNEISARRPRPWTEVLVEYTYPPIEVKKPVDGSGATPNISDCIYSNLENEFKDLGQDIFDEVFSIGDAIAKAFHDKLCRTNPDEVKKDAIEMGLNRSVKTADLIKMESMSQMQAFFTVDEKDPIFVNMCKRALLYKGFGGSSMQQLDTLYAHGLGPLKYCGLFDLLFEAMECLFKGLSLEEALGRIILAALNAMGVEDFGSLFVGLPPEKQAELDALVKKNLKSGKAFEDLGDRGAAAEQAPFMGKLQVKKPWEDEAFVNHQNNISRQENFGAKVPSRNKSISDYDPTKERRTLGQKLSGPSEQEKAGLDSQNVFDAYILAMIEVYQEDYLSLLDHLSNFPGAQIISAVIGLLDCPSPPLFNPGIMDFVKSLGLPFCRSHRDIVSPRIENPFAAWPKLTDILWWIFLIVRYLIIQLLMKILLAILGKICEIIGNAICKALETVGAVAGSLPAILSGREHMFDVIRDTICGPEASEQQVEDTVVDMMAQLGPGGAALADRDRAISFFADSMNAMTREELAGSFTGDMPMTAQKIIYNKVQFDYPEYEDAFSSPEAIGTFYNNVGSLIPAETRAVLADILAFDADELALPANPSLCASPEDIALFEEGRCALLEGRMSPAQCEASNESAKAQLLEDLDDIGALTQQGIESVIEANMPAVFSDPQCSNGLLPHEPEEAAATAIKSLEGDMEKLQVAYTTDMLGDAGWFSGQADWGFLNMAMSDTYGNPWTVHNDKVAAASGEWVDFYGQNIDEAPLLDPPDVPENPFMLPVWLVTFVLWIAALPLLVVIAFISYLFKGAEKGAYPKYVGGYLMNQFANKTNGNDSAGNNWAGGSQYNDLWSHGLTFISNNSKRGDRKWWRSFDDAGFIWRFLFISDTDVELVDLPDYGYNTKTKVNFGNETIAITRKARKDNADIKLRFRDNAKGYRSRGKSDYAYGFDVKGYYSDLYKNSDGRFVNRADDNIRVVITSHVNLNSMENFSAFTGLSEDQQEALDNEEKAEDSIVSTRRYEFLATDGGLEEIELSRFPTLADSFSRYTSYSPPVGALVDLSGGRLTIDSAEAIYNAVNTNFYQTFAKAIGENEEGWLFGIEAESLSIVDFNLGIMATQKDFSNGQNEGYSVGDFIPYHNFEIWNREEEEIETASDEAGVMGISYDQWKNETAGTPQDTRVFYLDPGKFGGSFSAPGVYAKPMPAVGWAGLMYLIFPEHSPCTPKSQSLVGFGDINTYVAGAYPYIPEDKRLQGDEDCIFEAPFNRILTRPSKAGIRGLIMAAIRIYGSMHIAKSIGTFATFAPDFKTNYSQIYAAYIVEKMKESMMESGGNFLNPFNDNEFWYAFLEQSVQFYADRIDDDRDEVITPDKVPAPVQEALEKINNLQDDYVYPNDFDDYNNDDYGTFESMESFRESKNLEAIKKVESEAKLVLQELVSEQLQVIGEAFIRNAHVAGFTPGVSNMDYYLFEKFTSGTDLSLQGKVSEVPLPGAGLPTKDDPDPMGEGASWPGPYYTTGGQLALPSGTPYVGEYHAHVSADGSAVVYMAGPEHSEEGHDMLIPFAKQMKVITTRKTSSGTEQNDLGSVQSSVDIPTSGTASRPFYLRTFIQVGGEMLTANAAVEKIRGESGNLSDHWPGSISLVKDPDTDRTIGVTGELGVTYGLDFGLSIDGIGVSLATTTLGAVDVKCRSFAGIPDNSKILWCLINQMRDTPEFRMAVDYVFSMKKSLSMLAIYNDMGLLPSIGQWTVAKGDMSGFNMPALQFGPEVKPGIRADYVYSMVDGPDGESIPEIDMEEEWTPGWSSEDDRNGLFSSFGYLDFDEWDQVTMRKSARRLKDLFRPYYRSRKFGVTEVSGPTAGEQFVANLTSRFRFNQAAKILPTSRKNQARSNPFNANGDMCTKPD